MSERIHADEPDTGESVVRALLRAECGRWATKPLDYLRTSGTDNAMWRVRLDDGPDVVVRLPRRAHAAVGVEREISVLRQIESAGIRSIVTTPIVRHVGRPHEVFPHRWSVLEWIGGIDAWSSRHDLAARRADQLATDLGRAVVALGGLTGIDVPERVAGSRGGPLGPLVDRLHRWLDDPVWNAHRLVDVDAVRRLAAEALEVADGPVSRQFVHGDLIPGNLLVEHGRLSAIIDWGGVGRGDGA